MRLEAYFSGQQKEFEDIWSKLTKDCMPFLKILRRCDGMLYRGVVGSIKSIERRRVRTDRIPKDTYPETQKIIDDMFKEEFGIKPRSQGVFATGNYDHASTYGDDSYLFFPISPYKFIWNTNREDLYADEVQLWQEKFTDLESKDEYHEEEYETKYGPMYAWHYDGEELEFEYTYADSKEAVTDYVINNVLGGKSDKFQSSKLKKVTKYTDSDIEKYAKKRLKQDKEKMLSGLRKTIKSYKMTDLKSAINSKVEIMFVCKEYYLVSDSYEFEIKRALNHLYDKH